MVAIRCWRECWGIMGKYLSMGTKQQLVVRGSGVLINAQ